MSETFTKWLIIFAASVATALLFYFLGGGLAEVSNTDGTFLGFGFRASGALGGFILILVLGVKMLKSLESDAPARPMDVGVKVRGTPRTFKANEVYSANYEIKSTRLKNRNESSKLVWDGGGYLKLYLDEVYADDRISVVITNQDDVTWEVDQFQIREPWRDARRRKETIAAQAARSMGPGDSDTTKPQMSHLGAQGGAGPGPSTVETNTQPVTIGPASGDVLRPSRVADTPARPSSPGGTQEKRRNSTERGI